jgi:hypothetical protein
VIRGYLRPEGGIDPDMPPAIQARGQIWKGMLARGVLRAQTYDVVNRASTSSRQSHGSALREYKAI